MHVVVNEENGYESSVDNDDDISSDEDPDVENKLEAEVGKNTCTLLLCGQFSLSNSVAAKERFNCNYLFGCKAVQKSRMVQSIIKKSSLRN